MQRWTSILALAAVLLFKAEALGRGGARSIYGEDDRSEAYDTAGGRYFSQAARAVGMIVSRDAISWSNPAAASLSRVRLGQKYNLCSGEAYAEQPAPGYCSGFLLQGDLFVTAGHCLRNSSDCSHTAIVFDFVASRSVLQNAEVPRSSVYFCRSVISHSLDRISGTDFSVVRLDRAAADRPYLSTRVSGVIDDNTALAVVGHPAGLPLKVATGGQIRDNTRDAFFVTDLDNFSGSSGSPVINMDSGLVEGLIVRGDADWETTAQGCRVAQRCPQDACRGEDVVRIGSVLDSLP